MQPLHHAADNPPGPLYHQIELFIVQYGQVIVAMGVKNFQGPSYLSKALVRKLHS